MLQLWHGGSCNQTVLGILIDKYPDRVPSVLLLGERTNSLSSLPSAASSVGAIRAEAPANAAFFKKSLRFNLSPAKVNYIMISQNL